MMRWLLGVLLLPALAHAEPVVVFGDSWAVGGGPNLGPALMAAGRAFAVDPRGVSGTTAEGYAMTPNALPLAVAANPDARWVWLSLGGNDVVNRFAQDGLNQVLLEVDLDLRTVLNALYTQHPNIQVVVTAYDYLNFQDTIGINNCPAEGATFFGATATQGDINGYFEVGLGGVLRDLANDYPNLTFVPLQGTLQVFGGVPVNPLGPSPAAVMQDCIHPQNAGYRALMDTLVGAYWDVPAPTAAISGPTSACPGSLVTVTSNSTNANRLLWSINGVPTSTQTSLLVITGPGDTVVTLTARNQAYTNTATLTVTALSCNDAGVDAGPNDAGFPDTGAPDLGPPDLGFPDTGFMDAQVPDLGFPDTGFMDAQVPDLGPPDTGFMDAQVPDLGFPDTGFMDAQVPDLGFPDTGFMDAQVPDLGFPDAAVDAGPDAAVDAEVDAGFEPDAEVDAGFEPDAGPDAAADAAIDAGLAPDAGFAPDADGYQEIGIEGSGCSSTRADPAWSLLAVFGLWALKRRRR